MVNEELAAYIKEQLNNGFSLEEIRNYLITGGYYTQDVVDVAIMSLNQPSDPAPQAPQPPPVKQPAQYKNPQEPQATPEKKGIHIKNIILYIIVIVLGVLVGLKVIAYFEIFDFYTMVGFDPFSFLGGTISGSFTGIRP